MRSGMRTLWIFLTIKWSIKRRNGNHRQRSSCRKIVVYVVYSSTPEFDLTLVPPPLLPFTTFNCISHILFIVVYEARQRAAFSIPVKSVSFKSFDYRRHRACALPRLVSQLGHIICIPNAAIVFRPPLCTLVWLNWVVRSSSGLEWWVMTGVPAILRQESNPWPCLLLSSALSPVQRGCLCKIWSDAKPNRGREYPYQTWGGNKPLPNRGREYPYQTGGGSTLTTPSPPPYHNSSSHHHALARPPITMPYNALGGRPSAS